MLEDINQLTAEYLSAWNAQDLDRMSALHAPEYEGVDVAQSTRQHGPEGICQMAKRYWGAFPDMEFVSEGTVRQGDQIALFWTLQATHKGTLMNIPPTGRPVAVRGVTLLTVWDSKIQRALYLWDVAGFLRTLGLLPDL